MKNKSFKRAIKEDIKEGEIEYPVLPEGELPNPEELAVLMNNKEYELNLSTLEQLAWDYAMKLSDNPLAGSNKPGKGFHSSLQALINAPSEEQLLNDFDKVDHILDDWYDRFPTRDIKDEINNLTWKIIESLNIDWISKEFQKQKSVSIPEQNFEFKNKFSAFDKLIRSTGISYRELAEDLVDNLDDKCYNNALKSLRNKYGYTK